MKFITLSLLLLSASTPALAGGAGARPIGNPARLPATPETLIQWRLNYTSELVAGSLNPEQEAYGARLHAPRRTHAGFLGTVSRGGIVDQPIYFLREYTSNESGQALPIIRLSAMYNYNHLGVVITDPFTGREISAVSSSAETPKVTISLSGAASQLLGKAVAEIRDLELACEVRP